nr:integrase, catalytic region, zinc finger, CCHC-type, peptidase aspartic, catalytic [Tanacetum cinerariifolium]
KRYVYLSTYHWYKEKAMLAEAGQILDEEQLVFLADPGVPDGQVLMANISNYGSDVISEVPHFETYLNDMEDQSVHAMQDFEQTLAVDVLDNEIHSDRNIISYFQYLEETQRELLIYVQDTCPNAIKPNAKKVDVTHKIKVKKVRFAKPLTLSRNIKQVESSITSDSNTHVLSPTRLKCSTSNYGSNTSGNHSQLINFVSEFLGTVRFKNGHITRIIGFGDYQMGNVTISRVYYVPMRVVSIKWKRYILVIVDDYSRFTWVRFLRTKDEAPEAIIKCIKNIQVRLNATVCNVQTDNGTEFVNKTLREFYENVGIFHQTSVAILLSRMADDLGKLDAKADIGIFVSYAPAKKAFRIYNKRTHKIIETIYVTFDELTTMASVQFSSGPKLQCMTPATSSSRLIPNTVSQQPCIPPNIDDWDNLFQPLFDEYFNPPTIVVSPFPVAAAPRAADLANSLVSTLIYQDAPSSNTSSTQEQEQSLNISQGFKESPKTPIFRDDLLNESPHEELTSQGSSSNMRQIYTLFGHLGKWTKDFLCKNMNPIANQQAVLDNALVPSEKRLKIERCNARIAFTKPQKEETYQVTLEALKLSPCYPAFQITAKEEFMYQADNREISSAREEQMPYLRFTKVIIDHSISKDNTISMRNMITFHTVRDDTLLGTLKFLSITEDYLIYKAVIPDGMINEEIKLSKAYKTYLDYATGKVPPKKVKKFKKPASPKLKTVLASPKEPTKKDTLGKSVSKKKAPANTDRGKGIKLLSHAALLDDAQLKETLRKSKQETHKLQASSSSEGANFESEVPNDNAGDSKEESDDVNDEDENDDGDNDDGGNDDEGDDDKGSNEDSDHTDSDDDKNPPSTLKDYEEEEQYEEFMLTPERNKSDDDYKMYEEEDDDFAKKLSDIQKNIYNVLVEAYKSDKDIFTSYGDVVTLKRAQNDQDMDEDSSAGLDRGPKRIKSSNDHKSYGMSTQAEEPEFEARNTEMHQDQGNESGHIDDQLDNEAAPKHDWFQKPDKPLTPDRKWNKSKSVTFRPPQKWISIISKEWPAFNMLKGTCKSFTKHEYHFKECYKAVNDRLDWHNPKGREYLFDLSKPLSLIEDRGCQEVPTDYLINNDLEYLKGGSSSSKYTTSTTRTKAAKIITVTSVKVMRWYNYGYLEEIVVCRDDNVLYNFKEGDFPRLNFHDIEDMLLLLIQKKLLNLDVDDRYDLEVAL